MSYTPLTVAYPAIFELDENGYFIKFPDIQGAYTGINEQNIPLGLHMAQEVLGMVLADFIENNDKLPKPSDISDVVCEPNSFVTLVSVDLESYLKDQTLIKKTLTIPKWANDLGKRSGLNFSQLLTDSIADTAIKILD